MSDKWTIKDYKLEIKHYRRRTIIGVLLVLIFAAALCARLVYLQVHEHQRYSTLSTQNLLTVIPIEPNRGLIYDRNGILLAKNLPVFNLSIIPAYIKNFDTTIAALKPIIKISENDLKQFQKRRKQYRPYQAIPLKINLSENEAYQFYVNQHQFPGLLIQPQVLRQYPYTDLLSNVIGYVGRINEQELEQIDKINYRASDYIGKTGIEKQYENKMHGKVGTKEVETDASGRIVRVLRRTPPTPGTDIYLTLDLKLQQAAMNALGEETGSVVALNPNTGEILAMVSKPSYNPNLFVTGISQKDYQSLLNDPDHPLYSRDIRGAFAPGSTIKPFYALAGLENGTITTKTRISDPGRFRLPRSRHVFRDWKPEGHGIVDVTKAIVQSCDTFFYTLAAKSGISLIYKHLSEFGFGQYTKVDLPRELKGLAPSAQWKKQSKGESWYRGDTVNVGIGQGYFITTPLQLAQATAILATRGWLTQPHLLLNTVDSQGNIITNKMQPTKKVTVKNPKHWDLVIEAMRDVISTPRGTAWRFGKDAAYTAAGKTGTVQVFGRKPHEKFEPEDLPRHLRNHHLFISFAPVENPEIVVVVILEHAVGADAVTRKVLDAYFHGNDIDPKIIVKEKQETAKKISPSPPIIQRNGIALPPPR